jgi:hypothetical protein
MPSLFDARRRAALHRRIDRLTPDAAPRWGRMAAPQMVCHLTDSVESAFDADTEPPGTGALARQPLKWLVLNVLPWPRGKMQSPARLTRRQPSGWHEDVAELHAMMDRLAARDAGASWPASEVFGALSRREWGALLHTHIDHHLKQFGV